ncbi:hypothetical protein GCM10010308_05620 [Streptomyces vinaceusdrappus]|nr:hypothetical protein GCM10010308_05620 [Streptomyces vinaceusdrappus]
MRGDGGGDGSGHDGAAEGDEQLAAAKRALVTRSHVGGLLSVRDMSEWERIPESALTPCADGTQDAWSGQPFPAAQTPRTRPDLGRPVPREPRLTGL